LELDKDEDEEKKPQQDLFQKQSGGDFDFLESLGVSTSTGTEINFSGFETGNQGVNFGQLHFGTQQQTKTTNNAFDFNFGATTGTTTTNTSQSNQGFGGFDSLSKPNSGSTFSNKSISEKPNPIKKLGNPFTSQDPIKKSSSGIDAFDFVGSPTTNQPQKTNSQGGFDSFSGLSFNSSPTKVVNPIINQTNKQPTKSAWDFDIDKELESLPPINMGTNSIQSPSMNMNQPTQGSFMGNTSTQNQFNNPSFANQGKIGWDDLDLVLGSNTGNTNPMNQMNQGFNSNNTGFNNQGMGNQNFGNTGFGNNNQGFNNMNFGSGFGQQNQNMQSTNPFQQNNFQGFGNQQQASGPMQLKPANKANPFGADDDFFKNLSNDNVNRNKNNAFNFIGKPQSMNNNDLI